MGTIHYKDWDNSYIPNIFQEIYLQKIYEPFLVGKKDLILFDLGMNIGLWSIYASKYAKMVYSFEPAKETFDIASLNLKDNGITNVRTYQKAIAEENGEATFYHSINTTMNSLNPAVNSLPDLAEEVETVRLDNFILQEKIKIIDFAKI